MRHSDQSVRSTLHLQLSRAPDSSLARLLFSAVLAAYFRDVAKSVCKMLTGTGARKGAQRLKVELAGIVDEMCTRIEASRRG